MPPKLVAQAHEPSAFTFATNRSDVPVPALVRVVAPSVIVAPAKLPVMMAEPSARIDTPVAKSPDVPPTLLAQLTAGGLAAKAACAPTSPQTSATSTQTPHRNRRGDTPIYAQRRRVSTPGLSPHTTVVSTPRRQGCGRLCAAGCHAPRSGVDVFSAHLSESRPESTSADVEQVVQAAQLRAESTTAASALIV